MRQYHDLPQRVLTESLRKEDGTGMLAVSGHQMGFDLAQGFSLVTAGKLHPCSTGWIANCSARFC